MGICETFLIKERFNFIILWFCINFSIFFLQFFGKAQNQKRMDFFLNMYIKLWNIILIIYSIMETIIWRRDDCRVIFNLLVGNGWFNFIFYKNYLDCKEFLEFSCKIVTNNVSVMHGFYSTYCILFLLSLCFCRLSHILARYDASFQIKWLLLRISSQ